MSKLIIPKVIGHRGAKAYAPENTLASIHAAADLGVEWVEIDTKVTKDGVAVVFHDTELDRCTNGSGPIAETDFKTIRELDAGSWFGDSFIGEKIPTLEEVLNAVIDRGLGINIELSRTPIGLEEETTETVLDYATRIWPDDLPPPLLSSFSPENLITAMEVMPDWPRSLLIDEDPNDDEYRPHLNWREVAKQIDSYTINCNGTYVTPKIINEYLTYGRPVLAYTINDPRKAQELFSWGVSSVFSDCPDVIREEIESVH